MGLHLNIFKSELISSSDFQVSDITLNLKSFSRLYIDDASLLGAPLFPGVVLDEAWAAGCRAVERLKGIGSQNVLILLRSSFSYPRVQLPLFPLHRSSCSNSVWQTSQVGGQPHFQFCSFRWSMASCLLRTMVWELEGCLCLQLLSFCLVAASTLPLQSRILASCSYRLDSILQANFSSWCLAFGPPPDPVPCKQSL